MLSRAYLPAVAVLVTATAVHLVNFAVTGGAFRWLDSGWVLSYPHVLATFGFASGALAGVVGARGAVGARLTAWRSLAVVSGALLLDHVTRFHDAVAGGVVLAPALLRMAAVGFPRRGVTKTTG